MERARQEHKVGRMRAALRSAARATALRASLAATAFLLTAIAIGFISFGLFWMLSGVVGREIGCLLTGAILLLAAWGAGWMALRGQLNGDTDRHTDLPAGFNGSVSASLLPEVAFVVAFAIARRWTANARPRR